MKSIHETPFTPGQQATVISRLAVALPGALEQLAASGIDIKSVLRHTKVGEPLECALAEAIRMLYNGGHTATIPVKQRQEPIVKATAAASFALFAFSAMISIPMATGRMDPHVFFSNRPGFIVAYDFEKYVLSALRPIDSAPESTLTLSELIRDASDSEICTELSTNHLTEWWHIALLIDSQENGHTGVLLTDGSANLFYIRGVNGEDFVVDLRWLVNPGHNLWIMHAFRLGEIGRWSAGYRVFSDGSLVT